MKNYLVTVLYYNYVTNRDRWFGLGERVCHSGLQGGFCGDMASHKGLKGLMRSLLEGVPKNVSPWH